MRVVQHAQIKIGEIDISNIWIDPKCRDDIPQILRGLQHVYKDKETKEEIFKLLEQEIAPTKDKKNGRPGMTLWSIFVLGILRVNLNIDYDRLHDLSNHHDTIREMLGHTNFKDKYYYHWQTLKDNIELITPEFLDKVNQIVVKAGYRLIKKKFEEPLHGRCDSFVVETNVHFPTDINLLLDATRTVIRLAADLCDGREMSDWRQSSYNIRCIKKLERAAQNSKRRKRKKQEDTDTQVIESHISYIAKANLYLNKAMETINVVKSTDYTVSEEKIIKDIEEFIIHGNRQIDQINRRIILGETIPHEEKVFSLFKPYTEWIMKGKAGVPVELGVRVCIMEDQHQFITYHKVMEKQTDDQVAVEMVKESKKRFGNFASCSYDKGFHSPSNQEALSKELELVVLPRKGKLSKASREIEQAADFRAARKQHSAVESAINALEVHGLDYCPDYGIDAFKRYVALAVVGRNIQQIGVILKKKEQQSLIKQQKKKAKAYDQVYKLAA